MNASRVILAVALLLAGCASQSEKVVVAVATPIPPSPPACREQPKAPPVLPDSDLKTAELAQHYARLKAAYLRERGRFKLCQSYVARLSK